MRLSSGLSHRLSCGRSLLSCNSDIDCLFSGSCSLQDAAGAPVVFHVASPSSEVEQVLQSALVQWHLTGAESNTTSDPASEEHFGISIAEGKPGGPDTSSQRVIIHRERRHWEEAEVTAASILTCQTSSNGPCPSAPISGMTAGVIPVVLNRGGVGDIVQVWLPYAARVQHYTSLHGRIQRSGAAASKERSTVNLKATSLITHFSRRVPLLQHGHNGFLAATPEEVADMTVNVFNLPQVDVLLV